MKALLVLVITSFWALAMGAAPAAAPAPAPAPATPRVPPRDPLYDQMLALDTAMFDAFNRCADPAQLARHAAFFARDAEFYHDLGGPTWGADAVIESTRKNVCGQFHRELDVASFRVYPVPGFGAITIGTHRFCHTATTCEGIGEFTMVWKQTGDVWQVTRALSYAHAALPVPQAGKTGASSDSNPGLQSR